jgi:3-methylcrotonyl-CoA carboxylase beta subunit
VREVIARLVDGSDFDEFKALYGTSLVCGFARIWGYPVAILANNGVLFSESALKGAHFIELACKRKIPLLFLQNISGFMVGGNYEAEGIAKHGAKLVTAVASAEVPKFTVLIGGSLAPATTACAAAPTPALPVHLAQQPDQRHGRRTGRQRARHRPPRRRDLDAGGGRSLQGPDPPDRYEDEGNPYYATARLWDDGIIDPVQTRDVLGLAISALNALNAPIPETTARLRRVPDVRATAARLPDNRGRDFREPV